MSLSEFIQEVSKLPIKVGSVNGAKQRFIQEFLKSHPEVKHILETGFHVGHGWHHGRLDPQRESQAIIHDRTGTPDRPA
jgi:hypothetical protein